MSAISKEDVKAAREAYNRAVKTDSGLQSVTDAKQKLENQVRQIYRTMQEGVAERELASMDVESINIDKEGIRVTTLKNAGITTVGQLLGKTAADIAAIDGIGDVMAAKIVSNVAAIKEQTTENARVRLSAEDKSSNMTAIVKSLHGILRQQQTFVEADRLFDDTHDRIVTCGAKAKILNSSLKWMFAGRRTKEEAIQNGMELSRLLESGYEEKAGAVLAEYRDNSRKGIANTWREFENNSAPYYALLENIIESGTISTDEAIAKKTVAAVTGRSALTEDLIDSISRYELSLDLLNANLRRYQVFGTQYILHQERVLLGDEMGLGKTMQAIAAFCHLAATGGTHFLVVCPLSVVVNWTREIQSNSRLNIIEVYGEGRTEEMSQWVTDGGVAITTYETLNKVPVPENAEIDLMVVDEAHYIKNPQAIRTKSVVSAAEKARRLLLMSGTPLENRVEEMQFLIGVLQPEVANRIRNMKQLAQAKKFREEIAPVYLRRVREDVLKELPDLVEKEQWGVLGKDEKQVYQSALRADNFMQARQVSWNVEDITASTKAARLLEIHEEAKASERKMLVFSFFKNTLARVSEILGEDCVGIIDGSVSSADRQALIDGLEKAPSGATLVCQIQAGGVGLNIQSASVVIFCEPQMKPSLETQAVSRAYRMGQSKSVMVHRLLIEKTVDEQIMELLHRKEELFDNFADDSVVGKAEEATRVDDLPVENLSESKTAAMIMKEECERWGIERDADVPSSADAESAVSDEAE